MDYETAANNMSAGGYVIIMYVFIYVHVLLNKTHAHADPCTPYS